MQKLYVDKLKTLLSIKDLKILIVEGNSLIVNLIENVLRVPFFSAQINYLRSSDFPEIEDFIKREGYHLVVIGGGRNYWPKHPIARSQLPKLVECIKALSPNALIIYTSISSEKLSIMEKSVDITILKDDFAEIAKALKDP